MNNFQNFHHQKGVWFLAPVIAWLGSIGGAVTTVFLGITSALVYEFALKAAILAVYFASIAALYLGIEACVDIMRSASPPMPEKLALVTSWFLPPNAGEFVQCILAIGFIEFIFKHKQHIANTLGR
jgi:hypothetical protein